MRQNGQHFPARCPESMMYCNVKRVIKRITARFASCGNMLHKVVLVYSAQSVSSTRNTGGYTHKNVFHLAMQHCRTTTCQKMLAVLLGLWDSISIRTGLSFRFFADNFAATWSKKRILIQHRMWLTLFESSVGTVSFMRPEVNLVHYSSETN